MPYIPDAYDAYRAHEAARESWLDRRPKCGVACMQTGRNFTGVEIDLFYYEAAEKKN